MKMKPPKPPDHLSAASRRLWAPLHKDFTLHSACTPLVVQLCESLDRHEEARKIVAAEGLVVKDRWQQTKPHPGVAIMRDAAATAARAWRLLGFDQQPPEGR